MLLLEIEVNIKILLKGLELYLSSKSPTKKNRETNRKILAYSLVVEKLIKGVSMIKDKTDKTK